MENHEAEAEIVGYLVQMGFMDEDVPREDVMAIFESALIGVYYQDVLVLAYLLLHHLTSAIDRGFFNKILPAEYGRPDKVEITFIESVKLSQEVRLYCTIFEVREGEEEAKNEQMAF